MKPIPATTVAIKPKPVTTGGARTIRAYDGDKWVELPCPTNTGRPDAATAFNQIRIVIDAAKVLTPEELR
jgi:hypothetical protein